MNKIFKWLLLFSFCNNLLLTIDNLSEMIKTLNFKYFANILLCVSVKDYFILVFNEIYYFIFFINLQDLNSVIGVLL